MDTRTGLVHQNHRSTPTTTQTPDHQDPQDLVAAVVVPERRYPLLPGWSPRLGHCVLVIVSPRLGICHAFEWGLYGRKGGRRTGAIRSYRLPELTYDGDGRVTPPALAELLNTVAGIQQGKDLRGQYYLLPAGGAQPALDLVQRWREAAPPYHFMWCSCMHFVASVMIGGLGDASAYPPHPYIRLWPGSHLAPRFEYKAKKRHLVLQPSLQHTEKAKPAALAPHPQLAPA